MGSLATGFWKITKNPRNPRWFTKIHGIHVNRGETQILKIIKIHGIHANRGETQILKNHKTNPRNPREQGWNSESIFDRTGCVQNHSRTGALSESDRCKAEKGALRWFFSGFSALSGAVSPPPESSNGSISRCFRYLISHLRVSFRSWNFSHAPGIVVLMHMNIAIYSKTHDQVDLVSPQQRLKTWRVEEGPTKKTHNICRALDFDFFFF